MSEGEASLSAWEAGVRGGRGRSSGWGPAAPAAPGWGRGGSEAPEWPCNGVRFWRTRPQARLPSRPAGQVAPATVCSFPGPGRVHFSTARPPSGRVRSPRCALHSEPGDHQGGLPSNFSFRCFLFPSTGTLGWSREPGLSRTLIM